MWQHGSVLGCLLAIGLLATSTAKADWGGPEDTVPVQRLLDNLQRQLEEHPDSHRVLSQIARVHSRAYALDCGGLPVSKALEYVGSRFKEIGPGYLTLWEIDRIDFTPRGLPVERLRDDQLEHLKSAIEFYTRATDHVDADAYDWLGLGYSLREAARVVEILPTPANASESDANGEARRTAYLKRALAAYWKAFHSRDPEELRFYNAVVDEAAQSIVAILSARKDLSLETNRELKLARRRIREMEVADRMVTPIIFSFDSTLSLPALLAPEVHVSFDLDGSGSGKRWPWVRPDTVLLVWDGSGDRQIPDGRSLIGSVTWWLFWETGYDVLRVLDDNRNGWLEGTELRGLGAWQDRNSNGISEAGEVRTLDEAGVTGLAVSADEAVEGMPANLGGLRLRDGRVLPTYDWITSPVAEVDP